LSSAPLNFLRIGHFGRAKPHFAFGLIGPIQEKFESICWCHSCCHRFLQWKSDSSATKHIGLSDSRPIYARRVADVQQSFVTDINLDVWDHHTL